MAVITTVPLQRLYNNTKKITSCYCDNKSFIIYVVIIILMIASAFFVSFLIYSMNLFFNHKGIINDIDQGVDLIFESLEEGERLVVEASTAVKNVERLGEVLKTLFKTGIQITKDTIKIVDDSLP